MPLRPGSVQDARAHPPGSMFTVHSPLLTSIRRVACTKGSRRQGLRLRLVLRRPVLVRSELEAKPRQLGRRCAAATRRLVLRYTPRACYTSPRSLFLSRRSDRQSAGRIACRLYCERAAYDLFRLRVCGRIQLIQVPTRIFSSLNGRIVLVHKTPPQARHITVYVHCTVSPYTSPSFMDCLLFQVALFYGFVTNRRRGGVTLSLYTSFLRF